MLRPYIKIENFKKPVVERAWCIVCGTKPIICQMSRYRPIWAHYAAPEHYNLYIFKPLCRLKEALNVVNFE